MLTVDVEGVVVEPAVPDESPPLAPSGGDVVTAILVQVLPEVSCPVSAVLSQRNISINKETLMRACYSPHPGGDVVTAVHVQVLPEVACPVSAVLSQRNVSINKETLMRARHSPHPGGMW
jgi:hypothetical protein